MRIPFQKAHGDGNDFLFAPADVVPGEIAHELARAICDRHTGAGADGLYRMSPGNGEFDAAIHLYNSDGSEAELSGNGTRCAAACLIAEGSPGTDLRVMTGAGARSLRLLERDDLWFRFEMDMGRPAYDDKEICAALPLESGSREVTILDVGNPQCVAFLDEFTVDWLTAAREIERHPRFAKRTNVAFVRVVGPHTLEARFFERGAGETRSSGTGSTAVAVAAILRGLVRSPVRVLTPAGELSVRWDTSAWLAGPAEIVARGEYYFKGAS